MFFKGSKSFPGAERLRNTSPFWWKHNAAHLHSTNYYFVLPRKGLCGGRDPADAIAHPLFDPASCKRSGSGHEESNRNWTIRPRWQQSGCTRRHSHHRMRRWRIGSNEVLRNIRRDDLISFFQSLYRPENIIVSIVGDVTHGEALEVVADFGARNAES